ncbi:MAG: putative transposase [Halieaceae bacterium]
MVGITVRTHQRQTRPTTYHAVAPYRLWSWDCAWLPGPVKGTYYYLVMIIDIFSPKFAGWEVFLGESADNVRSVLERAILAEHIVQQPLVLHADNGSAFKAVTLLEKLRDMNIEPSFSRPRISNDNPYSEALFRTCKYVPFYPVNGIAGLPAARYWMQGCVRWYNHEHRRAPDPDSIRA